MNAVNNKQKNYHLQPYHMNGLNWTLVDKPKKDNIIIVTGFMPSWWTQEYGITFHKDFHLNPSVHKETLCKMASILNERFGNLPNFFFSPFDYADSYPAERIYGDALIPALFGSEVSFDDASGHPYADCPCLSDEQIFSLSVPDVENSSAIRAILDNCPDSNTPITGELGYEGVLNIAYKLRGQEIFLDLIQKPDLAAHLLDVIFQTIDNTVHTARKWQNLTNPKPTYFVHADCMVSMISGEMYSKHLLELCSRVTKAYLIETADEIQTSWLQDKHRIGITSGASTDEQTIDEVVKKLESLN